MEPPILGPNRPRPANEPVLPATPVIKGGLRGHQVVLMPADKEVPFSEVESAEIMKVNNCKNAEKAPVSVEVLEKGSSTLEDPTNEPGASTESTNDVIVSGAKKAAYQTTVIVPFIVYNVLTYAYKSLFIVANTLGCLCLSLGFVRYAIELWRAHKDEKEYKSKMNSMIAALMVKGDNLTVIIDKLPKKRLKTAEGDTSKEHAIRQNAYREQLRRPNIELVRTEESQNPLAEKEALHQKELVKKIELIESTVDQLNGDETLKSVLGTLAKANINAKPFEMMESSAIRRAFSNRQFVKDLANDAVKKDAEIRVLLRNGLVTYAAHKAKIDQGLMDFRLKKAKLSLTTAGVIAAVGITAKVFVMAIGGGAITAFSATGYGLFGVAIGGLLTGAIYFKYKKPNLFRVYWSKKHVSSKINKALLHAKKWSLKKTSLKIKKIDLEALSGNVKSENLLGNLQQKEKKLETEINDLSKKLAQWDQDVTEAGWKDYQLSLIGPHAIKDKTSKEETKSNTEDLTLLPKAVDGVHDLSISKTSETTSQVAEPILNASIPSEDEIFAEFLLRSHQNDPNADKLWKMMGIDLESLKVKKTEGTSTEEESTKTQIAQCIRTFFGSTHSRMMELLTPLPDE